MTPQGKAPKSLKNLEFWGSRPRCWVAESGRPGARSLELFRNHLKISGLYLFPCTINCQTQARLYHCGCQVHATTSFSPLATLLPERTTPELLFLETKWAALVSYSLTVKLLQDVLPLDEPLQAVTIRASFIAQITVC